MQWEWIIAGTIVGLMGWMLYLGGVPLVGAVAGGAAGAAFAYIATGMFALTGDAVTIWTAVGGVVGVGLGFMLLRMIQRYAFFLIGAAMGGSAAWSFLQKAGSGWFDDPIVQGICVLAAAMIAGSMLVRFRRFVMAVVTSFIGAALVSMGLPEEHAAWGGLTAVAVFLAAQCGLVGRFVDDEKFDRRVRRKVRKALREVYENEYEDED